MSKSLLSVLFLLINYLVVQSQIFTNQYQFIPDSTATENKISQLMILNINKDRSEFYSLEKMKIDSTLLDRRNKGDKDPQYENQNLLKYSGLKFKKQQPLLEVGNG